jgi:AraC-like DNA-binding protein/mannose-6-phosphate isomerase-like protein (cupin superfamily)
MKAEYEIIHPDAGSSFRLLNDRVSAEQYKWQYHYHPEYELVCVVEGSGTRHVGTHISNYNDGDLVLMGPNLPHAGFGLNSHGIHEEIVIQVKEEVFNQSVIARPEMAAITDLLERSKHGICFLNNTRQVVTKRLVQLTKLPPFEKFIELLSILQTMATSTEFKLLNNSPVISSSLVKKNIRLQNILNFVETHFQEEIDIKKVAAIANLSVPSFCNYFKKMMNITFTDFVNQYRIRKACVLLKQEKTISEACFESGFNNVPYFNKVFKHIMLKTPSEFKKEETEAQFAA